MSNNEYKECPYCGEEILSKAIKCKYCKSSLSEGIAQGKTKKLKLKNLLGNGGPGLLLAYF